MTEDVDSIVPSGCGDGIGRHRHVVNACFVVKESPCCYNEKVSGDMILEFGSLHVRATGS
jgi:hypothetical protein